MISIHFSLSLTSSLVLTAFSQYHKKYGDFDTRRTPTQLHKKTPITKLEIEKSNAFGEITKIGGGKWLVHLKPLLRHNLVYAKHVEHGVIWGTTPKGYAMAELIRMELEEARTNMKAFIKG